MADQPDKLLEIRDLTVQYPSAHGWLTVVDRVSVSVGRNDIVCIVGESGSGKSVTTQAAVGLVQAKGGRITSGSVKFAGQELVGMGNRQLNRSRGNDIGFIFQEPMSSLQNAEPPLPTRCGYSRCPLWAFRRIGSLWMVRLRKFVSNGPH